MEWLYNKNGQAELFTYWGKMAEEVRPLSKIATMKDCRKKMEIYII